MLRVKLRFSAYIPALKTEQTHNVVNIGVHEKMVVHNIRIIVYCYTEIKLHM